MLPVSVRREVLKTMRSHARRERPWECCGLLSGRRGVIERATQTTNQRKSSTAFAIPPVELIAFFKEVRRRSEEFLGVYHSHPGSGPEPSQRDAAEFYYPEVSYWIVGAGLEVSCYRWAGDGFAPCSFKIAD